MSEKFEYDVPFGTIMDYVAGRFMLVIKDESWNEMEQNLLRQKVAVKVVLLDGVICFILESQPVDSADFYFNVNECDEKGKILDPSNYEVSLYFLNKDNEVVCKKSTTLTLEQSEAFKKDLKTQMALSLSEEKFDKAIASIQSRFEPYEIGELEGFSFEI